jgi:DNA replication protein DnaC
MSGSEPVRLGPLAEEFVARVERTMQQRRENTETLRRLWTAGELPKDRLPCYNSCEGLVRIPIDAERTITGFCPAHMEKGVCPLVDKAERELAARLTHAGFGSRYHHVDPERMRARAAVEQYLGTLQENRSTGRGLVLTGDVGVGKTMTLGYLARQMLKDDIGVWKVHMPTWTEELNDRTTRKAQVQRAIKVEVLMIDDLGSGDMPTWVLGIVEGIVEHRYANRKPVIVTTNLSREMLVKDVAFRRMVDRWRETCTIVAIGGTSQRHDGPTVPTGS